jgi:hypothetical protein
MRSLASGGDNCLFIIGIIGGILAGFGFPSFIFLFGEVMDAIDPYENTAEESLATMRIICIAFCTIGAWMFFTCAIMFCSLIIFA